MRIILCASLLALLSSCGNDNGGAATPDSGPMECLAEANFTWLHDEVFSKNTCTAPGCHPGSNTQGGLNLAAGKAAVYDALLSDGTFSAIGAGVFPNRVVMNEPAMSYLYVRVSEDAPLGGGRMPLTGIPLPDCQIEAIRDWIEAGAPND